MPAPTDDDMAAIVAALKAKGLNVIHANRAAWQGRMITVVVDEGDPHKVTVFEIWPEGLFADGVADAAVKAREDNGAGLVFEIGDNPVPADYVPVGN